MRDLPTSLDLLALGRQMLLDELLPLLPPERHRDAHLLATVMAIVAREARNENGWREDISGLLRDLYGDGAEAPELEAAPAPALAGRQGRNCAPPAAGGRGLSGSPGGSSGADRLQRRLARNLRNGAFETSPSRAAAARAILWQLTIAKLREGNPHFLAANGFDPAGEQGK
jgi:hypothetical protein